MLTLPAKMKNAFMLGRFTPVHYVEVTTDVLDAPASQQRRRYFGTIEGREGVELLYPAQPGDATQTETLIQEAWSNFRIGVGTGIGYRQPNSLYGGLANYFIRSSSANDYVGRTFTLLEDVLTAHQIKNLKVVLKRTAAIKAGWRIRARLYEVDADGNLVGFGARDNEAIHQHFGGGLESPTDFSPSTLALDTATIVQFDFDLVLIPGRRYAVILYAFASTASLGLVSSDDITVNIFWMGTRNENPSEYSFTESEQMRLDLSLQVNVAAYSYGGTPPTVKVDIDMKGTPVSQGFLKISDFLPTFFDPVTKTVKKTDISYRLYGGNSLGAETFDLGAVSDGSLINSFYQFYVLVATLKTAGTTTLIRTPLFKSVNLIFAQVVAGAPRVYGFSSHRLSFSTIVAISKAPSIPTRLDPGSYISERGGFEIELGDINGEVTRILSEQPLINLPVEVRVGNIDALTKEDMVVVGRGIISDYRRDEKSVTLTVEDRTKQLNVKIPKRSFKDLSYIESGGTASNFTLTFSPPFTSLTDKMLVLWKPHVKGSAGAVINVDALGNRPIYKLVSGVYMAVGQDDLPKGRNLQMVYDTAGARWILIDTVLLNASLGTDFRRDYRGKHFADVAVEIMANDADISRRWIAVDKFTVGSPLRNYLDAKWLAFLILTDQTEAKQLTNELMEAMGVYLTVLEDGLLRPIQYPRSDTSVRDWDGKILAAGDVQTSGFARTIKNAIIVKYDRDGDGKFNGVVVAVSPDSQQAWAPGSDTFVADREVKCRFLGPEIAYNGRLLAERIGEREVKARKNGMVPYRGTTALDQFEVQVGDYVNVTSPVFLRQNQIGMVAKQFMVIMKDPKWDENRIEWDLLEVIDVNRKPIASFTATPDAGTPPFTVNFDASASTDPDGTIVRYEWDFDYDGENFQTDDTGVTASHTYDTTAGGNKTAALKVTDNNGAVSLTTLAIRVRTAPTAVMQFVVSAPDQPLYVMLSSGSYSVTGRIVKTEWDLSYDGITFNAEVLGPMAILNLPYQEITVALRETDEDGLTGLTTQTFAGKQFVPSDVTGFFVDQLGDKLVFHWDANPETDLYAYEVREGATWNTSILIAEEVLTNSFTTVAPTTPGSKTYLVKAINTTGRKSMNATEITRTIFDTYNRNLLVEADRKASGWPGTKTGLVYEVARNIWWIASTDDQIQDDTGLIQDDTQQIALSGSRAQGSYEADPIDLGGIVEGNRLSIATASEIIPDPEGTALVTEYAESDAGISYSAFAQASQSDLGFRFVKERITLKNEDGASNIALTADVVTVDVPDVFDSGNDAVVPIGGLTINFNRAFNAKPAITSITIQNMTQSLYYKLTAITKTSFTVNIYRSDSNAEVGGTIDWSAKGF